MLSALETKHNRCLSKCLSFYMVLKGKDEHSNLASVIAPHQDHPGSFS